MSEEEKTGIFSCGGISWIVGALLGFAAYVILRGGYESGFLIALIVGLVLMVAVALLLRKVFCGEVEETEGGFAAMSAQRAAERKAYEAERAEAKAARSAAAEAAAAPEAEKEAEKEAAEAQAEAKVEEGVEEEAPAVQAEMAAAAEAPVAEAAGESGPDGRPAGLSQAREGGADDLKMIKGVGPKLEQLLHSLGIYHFDQIAAWGEKEIAWMDENLKGFKGRVTRDDWVAQAKVLAEGGTTAFAQKVKKGDVY